MSTPTYNLLAVRKTIGAIRHRLSEPGLDWIIRHRIIGRQIEDLRETLPRSFYNLLHAFIVENSKDDYGELLEGLLVLERLLPPLTYGQLVADTVFRVKYGTALYTKRKHGVEGSLALFSHFPAGTVVSVSNV